MYQPRMIGEGDCGEIGGMKIGRGNRNTRRKTCPSTTLFTINPTWLDPGLNPGLRCGKPATNRLSYGAAIVVAVGTINYRFSGVCMGFTLLWDPKMFNALDFSFISETALLQTSGHYLWVFFQIRPIAHWARSWTLLCERQYAAQWAMPPAFLYECSDRKTTDLSSTVGNCWRDDRGA
jgi:hypothetical protein